MPGQLSLTEVLQFFAGLSDDLQFIFAFFEKPGTAMGLAVLIAAAGVIFAVYFYVWRMLPVFRKLNRLLKKVKASEGYEGFYREFNSIEETFKSEPFLTHAWNEFKETLIFPEEGEAPRIRNTARPYSYINIDGAKYSGLRFFQALPNYFVGVGLLFTFIGLVAALYFASKGVEADSVQQAQDSLKKLLHAATFKFLTSIAGIFVSLFLSIEYRLLTQRLQGRFEKLCEALEERLLFATTESIAFDQYRELTKQTEQLERFNQDFALTVADTLNARLSESLPIKLQAAMQPLSARIENLAQSVGSMNAEAIQEMVEQFNENLQGAAGKEIRALAGSLEEIRGTIDTVATNLHEASQTLETGTAKAADQIREILKTATTDMQEEATRAALEFTEKMGGTADSLRRNMDMAGENFERRLEDVLTRMEGVLTPFGENMKVFGNTLGALDEKLTGMKDAFAGITERTEEAATYLEMAANSLQAAGAPVSQTAEQFRGAAERVEGALREMNTLGRSLSELGAEMQTAIRSMEDSWAKYQTRFEAVDQSLENVFAKLTDGLRAYQKDVTEFVTGLDASFGDALRTLGGAIENMGDNVEALEETLSRIGASRRRDRGSPGRPEDRAPAT